MSECCHKTLLADASYCEGCPVGVQGLVEGKAASLEEAHLVGYWRGYDDAKKGLTGLSEENQRKATEYDALVAAGVALPRAVLTDERIEQIGHRYAWQYKHNSLNPADSTQAIYTYNAHCLRDLLRAVERELLDGEDKWTPPALGVLGTPETKEIDRA